MCMFLMERIQMRNCDETFFWNVSSLAHWKTDLDHDQKMNRKSRRQQAWWFLSVSWGPFFFFFSDLAWLLRNIRLTHSIVFTVETLFWNVSSLSHWKTDLEHDQKMNRKSRRQSVMISVGFLGAVFLFVFSLIASTPSLWFYRIHCCFHFA